MALDRDQCLDGGSSWAPCGEESQVSIGNVATDQQSTRPKSSVFSVVIGSIVVGHPVYPGEAMAEVNALLSKIVDAATE